MHVLFLFFLSLFVQGFCVPVELSDDTSKDGATKFEDIEGGGIGDGEGVKDVSEQIESEEQVLANVSRMNQ